jgi:hypothetical protein
VLGERLVYLLRGGLVGVPMRSDRIGIEQTLDILNVTLNIFRIVEDPTQRMVDQGAGL